MIPTENIFVPAIAMEDDLGIVYLVENAQQFWSELEDILNLPNDEAPTLSLLDSTLKRFLSLCAAYHEQYLQSPLQLEHACDLLLNSELFAFHSERMCEILVDDAQSTTDPHSQLIFYHVLLCYGRRRSDFFRSHKRWQPLLPLLMDHVLVEIDPDIEDTYFGMGSAVGGSNAHVENVPVPIEAKLRSLGVRLLYEVCRVQKLSVQDLRIFDDSFIDYLFDLVEQTRSMNDETFNYSVIKLIVSLNEQFMVASLSNQGSELLEPQRDPTHPPESKNRVLRILMRRLGSTKTFGENMIFMLNRAQRTPEDLCMQLLVLKILYLLFTTNGTSEYFYTNDLCVLVDVFLRELVDLDEESESLRHTYLRVLHPLLTKTQLRSFPYKRPQIVFALESLMGNSRIRDINPTTKRLVERCLSGEWCVQFRSANRDTGQELEDSRGGSPGSDSLASAAQARPHLSAPTNLDGVGSGKSKSLKSSKSVEHMKAPPPPPQPQPKVPRIPLDSLRRPSNGSSLSLPGVAATTLTIQPSVPNPQRKGTASSAHVDGAFSDRRHLHSQAHSEDGSLYYHPQQHLHSPTSTSSLPSSPLSSPVPSSQNSQNGASPQTVHRRSAPAPPKRRKPPAIPASRTNGGATITTIKSSATSPLGKVAKVPSVQHTTAL